MMTERLTQPLTEIEKAELLYSIPGNLPQRLALRRLLTECDQLRAGLQQAQEERDRYKAAMLDVVQRVQPFRPGAARKPEGVWWGCDWCHFRELVWSLNTHTPAKHPENDCLVYALASSAADTGREQG